LPPVNVRDNLSPSVLWYTLSGQNENYCFQKVNRFRPLTLGRF